jgi:DNA-binding transcriptional regulator LsrR (DeoR family)
MRPGDAELKRLYEDERMTHAEIAARFGVTGQSVGRWLKLARIAVWTSSSRSNADPQAH